MTDPPNIRQVRSSPGGAPGARGFTLVEMMVSLSAGLIIASAAFALARNATTFFQAEANITSAQFATMVGLTRLQSDLRRAAFLSSPNASVDPKRCGPTTNWPANGMRRLAGIYIQQNGSTAPLSTANGLPPDALVVAGQFGSTEQFSIQAMSMGAPSWDIMIARDAALLRFEQTAANAASAIQSLFAPGRFLRVVDNEGRHSYGIIDHVNTAGALPVVTLKAAPFAMPVRETEAVCGCELPCTGGLVSVMYRVKWDIRAVDPATYTNYAGMFQLGTIPGGVTSKHKGEAPPARTELVRIELDQDGAEINTSLEVVTEFAVDLKFGLVKAEPGVPVPTLTRYPIGNASVYTTADLPASSGIPQRIRAVQVRLSTRSARRDRDVAIANPSQGGRYRFDLGAGNGFARMRTLISDVALPNLDNVTW